MTFLLFIREQWRVALFFLASIFFVTVVILLDVSQNQVHVPWNDIVYGWLLAVLCLAFYVIIEYWIRRPFYKEAFMRLRDESPLHSADTFRESGTAEQRLFLRMLQHYYQRYARELEQLKDKQRFFEMFTTRFVHQMKTPVTVIQLLERELRENAGRPIQPDAIHHTLDSLSEECARLDQSLSSMLYTARLNSFSVDAKMDKLDVIQMIRDVINDHKSEWIRKRLFPKIECPLPVVSVYSDKKWLRFIVEQLVRNALQYGVKVDERGTAVVSNTTFTVRVIPNTDNVTVQFIDRGIGIPKRDIRRVFDPFFTGENGRTHSRATGMGLYLVREVANVLGHQVSIDSIEGHGTTVTLSIRQSRYHPLSDVTKL